MANRPEAVVDAGVDDSTPTFTSFSWMFSASCTPVPTRWFRRPAHDPGQAGGTSYMWARYGWTPVFSSASGDGITAGAAASSRRLASAGHRGD